MRSRIGQHGASTTSIVGKLSLTVFFGIFAAAGLVLLVFMLGSVWQLLRTYTWVETPCFIESSTLESAAMAEGEPWNNKTWQVRYRYDVAGQEYVSTVLSLGLAARDTRDDRGLSQHYAPGEQSVCYVNPRDPSQAILLRESLWGVLWVLFPLPFAAVGFGGLWFTWRRPHPVSDHPQAQSALTDVRRRAPLPAGLFVVVFFGGFFVLGALGTYLLGIRPLHETWMAARWIETPCTIDSSRVAVVRRDDGRTFHAAIVFRYDFQGRAYTADRYAFWEFSSNDRADAEAIVARFPRGSTATCYVSPDDPSQAVLERAFSARMLLGLIPLAFAVVGAGGLLGFWRRSRRRRAELHGQIVRAVPRSYREAAEALAAPDARTIGADSLATPTVLEAGSSRVSRFVGLLVFGVIWNGIISIFVVIFVRELARGDGSWATGLFLLPFVVIGLLVLVFAGHAALAIFNPRPRVVLDSATVPPGGTIRLRWEMLGSAHKLRRFQLTLEGHEEARYRRGTKTYTDRSVFARIELADVRDPAGFVAGAAEARVPEETMHTFEATNNRIAWSLHVRGEIPRWPDIDDEFPFTVSAIAPVSQVAEAETQSTKGVR